MKNYDCVIIGGGPSGSTAAVTLARKGYNVLLLDRGGRIKPCGGAIPPRLVRDFDIPDSQIVARIRSACIVSPTDKRVDMPIDGGYVGMVDRQYFDEYLRKQAEYAGAERITGKFKTIERDSDSTAIVCYQRGTDKKLAKVRARFVVGADGANSAVAKSEIKGAKEIPYVAAYHEIVKAPKVANSQYHPTRCDVYYQGQISPDFYGWIFPHGDSVSVGVGSANKGFSLRNAVTKLRQQAGLDAAETIRCEGAPIPLKPLNRWDNGRDVILAGDAAGVVAPSSGEGIYYAMVGGEEAARSVHESMAASNPARLRLARKRFLKQHGRTFWVLRMMQYFWYCSDKRRERFVSMCADKDVQRLTWQAYMNKELVRSSPSAHARIFFKDLGHLLGIGTP